MEPEVCLPIPLSPTLVHTKANVWLRTFGSCNALWTWIHQSFNPHSEYLLCHHKALRKPEWLLQQALWPLGVLHGKKKTHPSNTLLWSVIKTVPGWNDGMGELDLVENQQAAPSVQPPLRCWKGLAASTTCRAANTLRLRLWSPIQGTPFPPPPPSRSRSHPSSHRQAKVTPFPRQAGHHCFLLQVPEHPTPLVGTVWLASQLDFALFPILPLPPPLLGCWLKYHSLINIRSSKLWLNLLPGEPKLLYRVKSFDESDSEKHWVTEARKMGTGWEAWADHRKGFRVWIKEVTRWKPQCSVARRNWGSATKPKTLLFRVIAVHMHVRKRHNKTHVRQVIFFS